MRPPRVDDAEGGDPSMWRAAQRVVARGLQVGGCVMGVAGWVMVRGHYEIVSESASMVLASVGILALAAGSWLYARALRTLAPLRDD